MEQKHYMAELKAEVLARYQRGESVWALHKAYGVSRHGIQRWCGLDKIAICSRQHLEGAGVHPKGTRVRKKIEIMRLSG